MSIREVRHLTEPEQKVIARALRRSVTIIDPPRQAVAALVREGVDISEGDKYGCHLVWWPDELPIPQFDGERGSRTVKPSTITLTPTEQPATCPECERRREYSKAKMAALRAKRKGAEEAT